MVYTDFTAMAAAAAVVDEAESIDEAGESSDVGTFIGVNVFHTF